MEEKRSRQRKALPAQGGGYYGDLDVWTRNNSEDNEVQMDRLRRNVRRVCTLELTEKQAEMIHLYYEQGMSIPEIAREKGMYKSSVSRLLSRGRKTLKRYLQYSW